MPITDRNGNVLHAGDRVQIVTRSGQVMSTGTLLRYPDPQGFDGNLTVDLGNQVHEYVPASWIVKL